MVDFITTIIGISLALFSAFCFNMAAVLQKKGLMEGPKIKLEEGVSAVVGSFKELVKNKTWLIGFLLGFIGWFPYIIAIGMVSVLVVSPVISVGLIVMVIAAKNILDEEISLYELSTIIMLIIATIIIGFAGISNIEINLDLVLFPFLLFFVIILGISFFCFYISKKNRGTPIEGLFIVFTGSLLYCLGILLTNLFTQSLQQANIFPLFFWEYFFGIFWFDYYHMWMFFTFWGMLLFNIISIPFYQAAFQKGKAVLMFPLFNIITLIIPVIAGIMIFNQSFTNMGLFYVALALFIIAILTLSKYQGEIELINLEKVKNKLKRKDL